MKKFHRLPIPFCYALLTLLIFTQFFTACTQARDQPANEIILYNWEDDIPQSVLDSFTAEFGVKVQYEVYESQEEAIENIRSGKGYDVVVMESRFIPLMVKDGLLAKLDYQNLLNFKYISPNFRDLAYDSGNRYSIPYSWGVTGLLVRTDLIQGKITQWSDLWDTPYADKVAIWVGQPREAIALTLKSFGYSANSENPEELNKALERLIVLKPGLHYLEDFDSATAAPALASNEVAIAMGYAGDYSASKDLGLPVDFVFPKEGVLIWGDTFVVPANSPSKYTAELFINFLLRPEISAEIVNQKHYASTNQTASAFIDPQILADASIYPSEEVLRHAEIILPLSADGQRLYDEIWQRFLNADPK